jgi:hypothetical protein
VSADLIAAARYAVEALDEAANVLTWGGFKKTADELRAALSAAEARPVQEPVYWQWRRKSDPWRLESHTFNCEVKATTDDSEVRALYASPPAQAAQPLTDDTQPDKLPLLQWAVERWYSEVSNRPLANKNRRTLDDTWRQVIRFSGGNPDALIGPSHDALVAAAGIGAQEQPHV